MKTLLIDDDATFRQRLALSLQKRGYEVACTDGIGALAALADFAPDAIVVDLKMPGEDGLCLIPKMKALLPKAKIIVLTGYGSITTAMEAAKHGAEEYLTKPTRVQQILNALEGTPRQASLDVPSLDQVQWEHLQRVLADCDNNISQAARLLGIDRRSLQRKLARHAPQQQTHP